MKKTRRVRLSPRPDPGPMPEQTPVPPRPKASPLPAARSVFIHFGVKFEESKEPTTPWRVADRFLYWPLSKLWREDGALPRTGYGAHDLCMAVKATSATAAGAAAVERALTDCQDEHPR